MANYLFKNGKNLKKCVINGIELHKYGIQTEILTPVSIEKNISFQPTLGEKTIIQMTKSNRFTDFALVFKYGVEKKDEFGNTEPQLILMEELRNLIFRIIDLDEPISIDFVRLKIHNITQMIIQNSNPVIETKFYDERSINCRQYSDSYFLVQSKEESSQWYVNTLDNSELQNEIETDQNNILQSIITGG